jgi:hypothetical protein
VEGKAAKNALLMLPESKNITFEDLILKQMIDCIISHFADPFEKENARQAFKNLTMKPYLDFKAFKDNFEYKATAAKCDKDNWKDEIVDRLYTALERALAREIGDLTCTYHELCNTAARLSRTFKKTWEDE